MGADYPRIDPMNGEANMTYDENVAGAIEKTNLRIKQLEEETSTIFSTGIDVGNCIITFETDQKYAKPKITVNEQATPEQMQRSVDNALYLLIKCKEGMDMLGLPVAPALEPIGKDKDKI